jgi:hypothetical protein
LHYIKLNPFHCTYILIVTDSWLYFHIFIQSQPILLSYTSLSSYYTGSHQFAFYSIFLTIKNSLKKYFFCLYFSVVIIFITRRLFYLRKQRLVNLPGNQQGNFDMSTFNSSIHSKIILYHPFLFNITGSTFVIHTRMFMLLA